MSMRRTAVSLVGDGVVTITLPATTGTDGLDESHVPAADNWDALVAGLIGCIYNCGGSLVIIAP